MKVHFYKYQATGNDFVVIDNLAGNLKLSNEEIVRICDRKFGVGADGLMLLEKHPSANFNLQYFNSDGSQSLCGNGSRAAVKMAAALGLVNGSATFEAFDGLHDAEIQRDAIKLRMNDVTAVKRIDDDNFFINTGSPHYVRFVKDVRNYPVFDEGKKIRYSAAYAPGGTNVNFVEALSVNSLFVRTYERGVENETLSCGTGVTAAALAASFLGFTSPVKIKALGGDLMVEFEARQSSEGPAFSNIYLIGPAKLVFEGDLEL
ncbi:MAG TPA: diaminopimelate epimerase [Chryseosolibacter sp.]|nr:diaminopimelate epimerase [Chryseosolibacter sp.]